MLSAYNWQNVAIDGGGFVDGIFYDPHNANVIYARTDIGGLFKTTNDGATWSELLDFVGQSSSTSGNGTTSQDIGVQSFAIDPENSNNLYAYVGQYIASWSTNGAVLYSTNSGQTWGITPLSFQVGGNSNGRGDGEQIAVDPNDSNIIFLGSYQNGLWESTNAGQSFTQISSSVFGPTSTTFVLFDPTSGTTGSPSQIIYVGINSTGTGTNLYVTTNGGTSWSQVGGTGSLPSGFLPGHAVLSNGQLYLGYANAESPGGNFTNGGVYRYTPATDVWANISPVVPSSSAEFGYDAVAADPENPNTVVVASFNWYSGPDRIWRTVNANAATPTWTELMDYGTAQNYGYGGYNTTRNTSTAPWIAPFGDGTGNWVASIAINPFNANQLMYSTGQGIWATNNASNNGANTQLTAANSWYFPDVGIEFTAVGGVATATAGVPLFSAMGDIFGFAHTTLTSSPAAGAAGSGSASTVAVGGGSGVVVILSTNVANDGWYSTNDGTTWTSFASNPGGSSAYSGGSIAVGANGADIVWAPSGEAPYVTTNDGATWTASTGGMATGGQVVADAQNGNYFYYYVGTDCYFSSNGGASFTLETSSAPAGILAVNPLTSGDLWVAASNGLYHSSNDGATFTEVSSTLSSTNELLALGAPAPGQSLPAIYVFGTINNFLGVYRSDDGGQTWTLLNDVTHQWGGLIETMAADPKVFGRLYMGINGRGIIMGQPTGNLPSGWSDTDVNTPGNPGWATWTTTLSNGTVAYQWIINGGGAGFASGADQLNFTYQSISGNGGLYVKLMSLTNADGTNGTPEAGVMYRASTNANDPFAAIVQTAGNSLVFEYRTTAGGSVTSTTLGSVPVGGEYLMIQRTNNSFAAYYGTSASTWTELGSAVTISAMPATANVGLIATSDYNPQLTSAEFSAVTLVPVGSPSIATPAAASPSPVTQTTTTLSVLGAEAGGEWNLTYTWATTGTPPAPVTFSQNGTNAAKTTTATFTKSGTYSFTVTVTDNAGLTATSSVIVMVNQTVSSIAAQYQRRNGRSQRPGAILGHGLRPVR